MSHEYPFVQNTHYILLSWDSALLSLSYWRLVKGADPPSAQRNWVWAPEVDQSADQPRLPRGSGCLPRSRGDCVGAGKQNVVRLLLRSSLKFISAKLLDDSLEKNHIFYHSQLPPFGQWGT